MNPWRNWLPVLALVLLPACARAECPTASRLALQVVESRPEPDGPLAQRVIDREWGPSDDSTYTEVDVPGWKSEGLALTLSGVLPGTGQLYNGDGSGWLFLLVEAAGWAGHWYVEHRASQEMHDLEAFVGNPYDSTAAFSFARYHAATDGGTAQLEQLWAGDRNSFYRELVDDPGWIAGFGGPVPYDTYQSLSDLLTSHDDNLHRASLLEVLLWLNHVVGAADALRGARVHDQPLRDQYHLELGETWRGDAPALRAALVRRF